jgi:hypothetical protein
MTPLTIAPITQAFINAFCTSTVEYPIGSGQYVEGLNMVPISALNDPNLDAEKEFPGVSLELKALYVNHSIKKELEERNPETYVPGTFTELEKVAWAHHTLMNAYAMNIGSHEDWRKAFHEIANERPLTYKLLELYAWG